ncbi:hypothetical protein VTI28DRAFT_9705 [Corynascus sepedonium]
MTKERQTGDRSSFRRGLDAAGLRDFGDVSSLIAETRPPGCYSRSSIGERCAAYFVAVFPQTHFVVCLYRGSVALTVETQANIREMNARYTGAPGPRQSRAPIMTNARAFRLQCSYNVLYPALQLPFRLTWRRSPRHTSSRRNQCQIQFTA